MIPFILLLWSISFSLVILFHVGLARSFIDATGLTCLSVAIGYILTIFYEHRQHRIYINWIKFKDNETEPEGF